MPPQIVPSTETADGVACDVIVVPAVPGDGGPRLEGSAASIDEALDGALTTYLSGASFKAKVGEVAIVPTLGRLAAGVVAVVGLGPDPTGAEIRRAAGTAARRVSGYPVIASALHEAAGDGGAVTAAAEGLLLGSYRFTRYRSDPKPSKIERVLVLGDPSPPAIERAEILAEATVVARDLVNEPAGELTPDALARKAREIADVNDLECTIVEEDELARRGFGGILGVARGSEQPPRLIHLRYVPEDPTGKVALVGKGITFDSGGLSLKDAKNMETMKTDMSGGAAVIAAMSAVRRLGPRVEIDAYVPATENMPGGNAIKPGDVIKHYGGQTSEVLNTDAEGRLVLADAVALASEKQPDALVDVATLTGAIMVALGRKAAGLFSTDDELAAELERAAVAAGERVWRMPLYDDYRSDLDSEIADIKNTGTRYGGAIYGALFVRDFVGEGISWAHLDIAGAARAESDHEEVTRGGSGVATRTLLAWLEGR